MSIEHPFAMYVRILGKGRRGSRSLTYEEAFLAMGMILRGECEDVQLGAFLMLLRVKEESGEELAGFAAAARQFIQPTLPTHLKIDLDWSSYAGKRRHLPWYLLATFALADSGIRTFMHGANGHTANRLYTDQALKHLGVPEAENWAMAEAHLSTTNFAYMPMSTLCPKLQSIIDLRNTFGLRSPVHSFSRLLNPLDAPYVAQGVFHPGYGPSHQASADLLGYHRLSILKGEGGEIECNPDAIFKMHHCFEGEAIEEEWPALFSKRHVKPDALDLDQLKAVWQGESTDEYSVGAVIGTLAFVARLMGKAQTAAEAVQQANDWWASRNLNRLSSS